MIRITVKKWLSFRQFVCISNCCLWLLSAIVQTCLTLFWITLSLSYRLTAPTDSTYWWSCTMSCMKVTVCQCEVSLLLSDVTMWPRLLLVFSFVSLSRGRWTCALPRAALFLGLTGCRPTPPAGWWRQRCRKPSATLQWCSADVRHGWEIQRSF